MSGRKDDAGKTRMELLPPELLEGVARVLTFGAAKYADRNWEKGIAWSRVYGALLRHMNAWWGGEAVDRETGMSHLWHAGCCLSFLMAFEQRGIGPDDRPGAQKPSAYDLLQRAFPPAPSAVDVDRFLYERPDAPQRAPVDRDDTH